jgi:GPI mannosyltransferase 1 subunit M
MHTSLEYTTIIAIIVLINLLPSIVNNNNNNTMALWWWLFSQRYPWWRLLTQYPFIVGLTIRLALATFLPWAMDQGNVVPGVAYTDIDYHVYSDAADYIRQGGSPYQRSTYRYTPFLAVLFSYLPRTMPHAGRYLLCLADALCGSLIVHLRRRSRTYTPQQNRPSWQSPLLHDGLWWMYNPLAINICTRGSADSLQVLLPVLVTIAIVTSRHKSAGTAALAGFWHGIAVHAKLYPIIYSLALVVYIACNFPSSLSKTTTGSNNPSPTTLALTQSPLYTTSVSHWIRTWLRRLVRPAPLVFVMTFVGTFVGVTAGAVHLYGPDALHQGLLYHLSRVDHRHNYALHWYWIYLARARTSTFPWALMGRILWIPQAMVIVVSSLTVALYDLPLALCLQTMVFVALNQVVTAQYFTWYLCLVPLCSSRMDLTSRSVRRALFTWIGSMLVWLTCAYGVEMQGWAGHLYLWMASVVFCIGHLLVLHALLTSIPPPSDTVSSLSNVVR